MPENTGYQQIVSVVVVGTIITLLVVCFLISFVYLYQKRHFKYSKEKELLRNQFQEELLKTQLEIQEQTFQTISEEIHDNIGQALSIIKLNINLIINDLPEKPKAHLLASKDILTRTIRDLRDLSKTLNTDYISELGIVGAIDQQLSLLQKTGNYETKMEVNGNFERYAVNRELILYRVVQELLNNIIKHANATAITTTIEYLPEKMILTLEDNGIGIDIEKITTSKSGIGIINMKNRLKLIDGKMDLLNQYNSGTCAIIELYKNGKA